MRQILYRFNLVKWCEISHLLLNSSKTKELIISNLRHQPITQPLMVQNSEIEQVLSFKYLGTTITSKADFSLAVSHTVTKARRRLHLIRRLRHLGVDNKLITLCHKTFIESILMYNIVAYYNMLKADSKRQLQHVISSSARFARDQTFSTIEELCLERLKTKSLRILTSEHPILTLEKLPSGRLRAVRGRTNLRKKSFRANCIRLLNNLIARWRGSIVYYISAFSNILLIF